MRVILAGVGGQGILLMTRVLADTAARAGIPVISSETHGMAQRGGSVVSHIKWGKWAISPLIAQGGADLLVGLDEEEGLRNLGYLRPGGRLLLNLRVGKVSGEKIQRYLRKNRIEELHVPATSWAASIGRPRGTNLLLLGVAHAMGWIPFSSRALRESIRSTARGPITGAHLECFEEGIKRSRVLRDGSSKAAQLGGGL
jgi:indolepyruvate ferredoxin oxidoreductase beta subunit